MTRYMLAILLLLYAALSTVRESAKICISLLYFTVIAALQLEQNLIN